MKTVLTIAGSDSGAGAGIQADLKAFRDFGCFGMSVVTAITAQNTQGISAIASAPLIREQLVAILSDFEIHAIKIGMLWDASTIALILRLIPKDIPMVVDPVMLAKGGASLLKKEALPMLKQLFLRAALITPNLFEASTLLGKSVREMEEMEAAARDLKVFSKAVLLKGGHLAKPGSDCLYTDKVHWFHGSSVDTKNTHGTGCTYSSAIAANLALGCTIESAVDKAKKYLQQCLEHSRTRKVGKGIGPCNL